MGDRDGAPVLDGGVSEDWCERARRPVPERTAPERGWQHLYTLGADADAASRSVPLPQQNEDDVARVVRDGYRTLADNLRRGRQAAEDLRDTTSGVSRLAHGSNPQAFVSTLARAFFDPALTRPFTSLARSWMNVFTLPARFEPASSTQAPTAAPSGTRIPLHPQERVEYRRAVVPRNGGPRLLGLSRLGPGEWVGDLEVEGRVRRVQIRELEEL
jgi:hypothetical protein